MAVLMASYITLSPAAQHQLETLENLNGAFLNEAEVAQVSETALDDVLAKLDAPEEETEIAKPLRDNADLPLPLREVLSKPIEDEKWRFAYPGVRQVVLPLGDYGETVKLLKIKPGKAAPRHTHKGVEATLVLRGAFRDGNRLYERGELALADQHIQHRPRAEGTEDCICLAVTDGALRFTDSIGRLARDFFSH